MVKRNHHYSYRRIAYQLKYSGQKASGEMASVKYCYSGFKSRILQKPADDKPSGNWKTEGANQPNCASVERGHWCCWAKVHWLHEEIAVPWHDDIGICRHAGFIIRQSINNQWKFNAELLMKRGKARLYQDSRKYWYFREYNQDS